MRILILGASGMAGHVVTRWLKECGHQVITHVYRSPLDKDSVIFDVFKNSERLDRLIEARNPDVIINCIGLLPADCDCHPDKAAYLNAFLPQHLATRGVKVIHISTDCVFSGNMSPLRRRAYTENAVKDAQTIYGITKSAGELNSNRNLTIRTSIVGPELKDGSGLFAWFQRQTSGVQGWANAFWNGVTTLELAKFIEHAKGYSGICHLHSPTPISKFEMLELFKKVYGGPNISITSKVLELSIDKTIVSTRDDISYSTPDFEQQLRELKAWYSKETEAVAR